MLFPFINKLKGFHYLEKGISCCAKRFFSVKKSELSKLRKITGISITKCKEALLKFDNNIEEAQKWLKEESLKHGWTKMGKLYDRPMSNGLLGLQIKKHGDGSCAVIVELNCETDFVARNQNFHKLLDKVTQACFEHFSQLEEIHTLRMTSEEVNGLKYKSADGESEETVSNIVASEVGSVGENMRVRRAVGMRTVEGSLLTIYSHLSWQDINKRWGDTLFGKYGAILKYRCQENNERVDEARRREVRTVGQQICQHIVGMNPARVSRPDPDRPRDASEHEDALLLQQFLLDEDRRVKDVLAQHGLIVDDFVRFACGEEATIDG